MCEVALMWEVFVTVPTHDQPDQRSRRLVPIHPCARVAISEFPEIVRTPAKTLQSRADHGVSGKHLPAADGYSGLGQPPTQVRRTASVAICLQKANAILLPFPAVASNCRTDSNVTGEHGLRGHGLIFFLDINCVGTFVSSTGRPNAGCVR